MAMFHESFNDINDLFQHNLKDLYDAEHQLTEELPKMADAATSPELKSAFTQHLAETKQQITRLDKVFQHIKQKPERVACPAMKGLVKEGQEVISASGDPTVKDAALIGAAQKSEHYEIASYGTLRTMATQLGMTEVASLLQQNLDEEGQADKKLTAIAEGSVNKKAARTAH